VIRLDPLEQIADLDIRVSVMAVTNLGPSPEHCIRFIEEKDRPGPLRRIEEPLEVLLCLPYVLADERGQIDLIEVEAKFVRDHLGRHRLAGPGGASEQRADPEAATRLLREPHSS
jgi:hypothetical protein